MMVGPFLMAYGRMRQKRGIGAEERLRREDDRVRSLTLLSLFSYLQKVHYVTYWLWIVFREVRSADAHSG